MPRWPSAVPLIDTIPSQAVRREFTGYLQYQLETAKTLGLDQVGLPISLDAIEALFGVAKQHGVGETQDAARNCASPACLLRSSHAGGSRAGA